MWKTIINLAIKLAPTRLHRISFLLVNLCAVVLAFVPLFNIVGYESAAFFGVVLGIAATFLTVHCVRSGYIEAPLSKERVRKPALDFGRLLLIHLALAAGPLLILCLNGLRVLNCDWLVGFGFWLLIPGGAILLGQGAGWVATAIAGHKRVAPWLIAFSFPLVDAAALLYHLYSQPPIVGHQWFMGYFGGSIYDEALAIPESLLAYRALHLLAVLSVVAAIQATYAFRRRRPAGWTMALSLLTALIFVVGFSQRAEMGIGIDRGYIIAELGGVAETEHFIIYYSETAENIERLDELIADHEFRYHQLKRFFGTDPVASSGQKVRSFVYGGRNEKGRLMGGRDTMVAKLWLHEMHILWRGTGDHLLAHELAHIFTEPFGTGPLRLSMQRGVGVNMGLVEGAAAAAEWPSQDLTPHEASAAMRQLGIAPDLRATLGAGGFWTQASGRAYTAMGSFVRYLIDRKGIEAFKQVYGRGDFQSVYGVSVEELIADWEAFIDQIELTERQQEVARYRFARPSIFGKECARARAELRRQARDYTARGALGKARRCYEDLLLDDPKDITSLLEYARVLGHSNMQEQALQILSSRPHELLSRVQEARFLTLEGDLHWLAGNHQEAAETYAAALEIGLPIDGERSLLIKQIMAERRDDRARDFLVESPRGAEAMYVLMNWHGEEPDDPLVTYLLGRLLWQARAFDDAIEYLERIVGQLGAEVLDAEAWLMLGQSYFFAGRLEESRAVWRGLSSSEITRYRERSREWLLRLDWAMRNRD